MSYIKFFVLFLMTQVILVIVDFKISHFFAVIQGASVVRALAFHLWGSEFDPQ